MLRLLTRVFGVTVLCFYRWKGGWIANDLSANVTALRQLAEVDAFPIPQEHSRGRRTWDHVRSVLRNRVYTVYEYESHHFRARLRDVLRGRGFQLVHVDSLDLSGYLEMLGGMRVVCTHHNVESALLRRRASFESSVARRIYMAHQAALMQREERRWCPQVALNVTVSENDRHLLSKIAPDGRYTVVPNGVDTNKFRPRQGPAESIVFVGGTKSFANRDALQYFSADILPHVRKAGEAAPVQWVGRCTEEERRTFGARYNVELTGFVSDVRPYVHKAGCYIAPLRVGGGTRLKILDAWAMGKAVVSTSVGCEGLAAVDGENILVRDEPREFADAVAEVMHDDRLRRRLGESGRTTVEQLYGWEIIGKKLTESYLDIASDR